MSQSHAAILDDESDRGLRRGKKCSRGEDDNLVLNFVVGKGVGEEKYLPLPIVGYSRQPHSPFKMADLG